MVFDYVRVYKPKPAAIAKILRSEFIFEKAPFASCHASTIVETDDGLLAAWFGGSAEGADDVGIWMARFNGKEWSAPVMVATGIVGDETSEKQGQAGEPGLDEAHSTQAPLGHVLANRLYSARQEIIASRLKAHRVPIRKDRSNPTRNQNLKFSPSFG